MKHSASDCCNAPIENDATGDRICMACGTIMDNYPEKKEDLKPDVDQNEGKITR